MLDLVLKKTCGKFFVMRGYPTKNNGTTSVLVLQMASIEVSLSTTPRRKNGKKSVNGSTKTSPPPAKPTTLVDSCKELEMLRNALRDKENTIQNLQGKFFLKNLTGFDSSTLLNNKGFESKHDNYQSNPIF